MTVRQHVSVAVTGLALLAVLVGFPDPATPRGGVTVRRAAARDVSRPLVASVQQTAHGAKPPPGPVAGFVARKIRIPDGAVFLITGIAIGPHALGLVDIRADSALNQIILLFGASYILFDGGASLRLEVLKRVWITIVVIATIGLLITAAITGIAAHYILGVPLVTAMLLAATLASTDPATLVPIFG